MIKRQAPTITQTNIMFFITAVVTLLGSAFFQPKLGIGTNIWINEFVYILFPPLLIARINGWPVEEVYRFRKISVQNKFISMLSAFAMWPLTYTISKIIRMFLDDKIGIMSIPRLPSRSIYQNLLFMMGVIILAPICEEIFFRGFVQRAYEGRSKKYGFVIAALIFGSYHVLNGISEVIPACILGLGLGFLVYKTDSLESSMLFHAAANICALFMGGVFDIYTRK
jgi:membrane protease YdiL (CAAX protease family)